MTHTAISTQGVQLLRGDSKTTLKELAWVSEYPDLSSTPDTIDVTTLMHTQQERCPGRSTHGGRTVMAGQHRAFFGHGVQMGRVKSRLPLGPPRVLIKHPEVPVAEIVGEDEDDVGPRGGRQVTGQADAQAPNQRKNADQGGHGLK